MVTETTNKVYHLKQRHEMSLKVLERISSRESDRQSLTASLLDTSAVFYELHQRDWKKELELCKKCLTRLWAYYDKI